MSDHDVSRGGLMLMMSAPWWRGKCWTKCECVFVQACFGADLSTMACSPHCIVGALREAPESSFLQPVNCVVPDPIVQVNRFGAARVDYRGDLVVVLIFRFLTGKLGNDILGRDVR